MAQRAPEAIELPDHQDIARTQTRQQGLKHRPLGLGAADHFLEDLRAASSAQGIDLQVNALLLGADPRVADLHGPSRRLIGPTYSFKSRKLGP